MTNPELHDYPMHSSQRKVRKVRGRPDLSRSGDAKRASRERRAERRFKTEGR